MSEFNRANAYDHLMKILIIGDSGSNKRQLLGKYLQDDELTDTTTLGKSSNYQMVNNFFQDFHKGRGHSEYIFSPMAMGSHPGKNKLSMGPNPALPCKYCV